MNRRIEQEETAIAESGFDELSSGKSFVTSVSSCSNQNQYNRRREDSHTGANGDHGGGLSGFLR